MAVIETWTRESVSMTELTVCCCLLSCKDFIDIFYQCQKNMYTYPKNVMMPWNCIHCCWHLMPHVISVDMKYIRFWTNSINNNYHLFTLLLSTESFATILWLADEIIVRVLVKKHKSTVKAALFVRDSGYVLCVLFCCN